jgi:hypothetical protein
MSDQLKRAIEKQTTRTIHKYHALGYRSIRDLLRREKRTGKHSQKSLHTPPRWKIEQQFDPFYVKGNLGALAHAIEKAIKAKSYVPRPCLNAEIAKDGGGKRRISIYCIPDAAVGTWLRDRLQERNRHLLSKSAFAYRADKNANDAIRLIADAVRPSPRLFVVEYDFEKFFDSIGHPYLLKVLAQHFQVRSEEMAVLRALLAGNRLLVQSIVRRPLPNASPASRRAIPSPYFLRTLFATSWIRISRILALRSHVTRMT